MANINNFYECIIIGAGPSGLTAAKYIAENTSYKLLIIEKANQVGGLAKTIETENSRYDIGPHRFFSKNDEANKLFDNILGKDSVTVNRKTRILFKNKYFDYPLTPVNAMLGLGLFESFRIGFSYLYARLIRVISKKEPRNFEEWVIDKFGKRLYHNFFKNYTEKVWGIDCYKIGKDWAAQRIKGLNLTTAITVALGISKNKPKSLIDKFVYPKYGAGFAWEKLSSQLSNSNVEIKLQQELVGVKKVDGIFKVQVKDLQTESIYSLECKKLLFSSPILEFINIYENGDTSAVKNSAKTLNYRSHICAHITIDKKLFDDNWIYIHSPDIKAARISDFTNFSSHMSKNNNYPLAIEYFCYENDDFWNQSDNQILEFTTNELNNIFDHKFSIIESFVTRNKYAYPVIQSGYEESINNIKNWIDSIDGLEAIGRTGMYKYNNQDHAMITGLYAAKKIIGEGDFDPWQVNVDGEYIEEIQD